MKICRVKPGIFSAVALWFAPLWLAMPVLAETPNPENPGSEINACQACQLSGLNSPSLAFPLAQNNTTPFRSNPEEVESEAENVPTPAQIQQQSRQLQQRLQAIQEVPLQQIYLGAPGSSSNTPTAYGGRFGSVGVGFSYQQRTRFTEKADGTAGIVTSFGNPQTAVGLDVGVTALDLSDFGDRGSFNFKLHRRLPQDFAVAVGLENALIWGFSDGDTSLYSVVSKRFRVKENSQDPFSRVAVSAGVGTGRFRTENQVEEDVDTVGVFGSVAVQVIPPVSVFTEWTGQDLNVGASVVPFRNVPLVITPTLSDLTGTAGDGTRFTLGVGYGLSLF